MKEKSKNECQNGGSNDMKRKGMGKRIAAIVLAITMSISMAGFQTGIVKAEIAVETS